jgi:hypothetical protein
MKEECRENSDSLQGMPVTLTCARRPSRHKCFYCGCKTGTRGAGTVMYHQHNSDTASMVDAGMQPEPSKSQMQCQYQDEENFNSPLCAAEGLCQLAFGPGDSLQQQTSQKIRIVNSPGADPRSPRTTRCYNASDVAEEVGACHAVSKAAVSKPRVDKRGLRKRTAKGCAHSEFFAPTANLLHKV